VALPVSLRESGGVTIMDLRGRATIDAGESEQLAARLTELVKQGTRKIGHVSVPQPPSGLKTMGKISLIKVR
jgi:hypothetical protein